MKYFSKCFKWTLLSGFLFYSHAWSSDTSFLRGENLGFEWVIPFVGLLLSIAFMPLFMPNLWHKHYGKIGAGWAILTSTLLAREVGLLTMFHSLAVTLVQHYIPFILMIGALYVITGGIRLNIQAPSTPFSNTIILGAGTLLASVIGTTGSSMLFIQPFLLLNKERQVRRHLVIFFIILVCNVGGALSPIGDPPLLLGFLKGVPFFWPLMHLFMPFIVIFIPVLGLFYAVDRYQFMKEKRPLKPKATFKFSLQGYDNVLLLAGAILCLFIGEISFLKNSLNFFGMRVTFGDLVRDISLLGLAFASLKICQQKSRFQNQFTWAPLTEIIILFAAIFVTVEPVLTMLKAGDKGAFSGIYKVLTTAQGEPLTQGYFWLTGLLSSFLDNAPTYLIFFNLAGGDAQSLTTALSPLLVATSAGAVFMGALTYIGNAPNFMVKSIAEANSIEMPSFFHYTLLVSLILLPLFTVLSVLFFS